MNENETKLINDALLLGIDFAIQTLDQENVYDVIIKSGTDKGYLNGFRAAISALYAIKKDLNEEINNG